MKRWSVFLLLLCCANPALQQRAEQSADRALAQLTTPWSEGGPPSGGLSTTPEELATQLLGASPSLLSLWGVKPHDPAQNPDTQALLVSARPYRVQLDRAPSEELSFLLQTYSGELFVLLFAQTEEGAWAPLGAYRLPSLARKESCRAPEDGPVRIRNVQATNNAPAFLWVEVQTSDRCAALQSTTRTLHLLALQRGALRPTLEVTLLMQSQNEAQQRANEQLEAQVKLNPAQNTLLISGVRRMFPASGAATGQEAQLLQWYYFDGTRYQTQR